MKVTASLAFPFALFFCFFVCFLVSHFFKMLPQHYGTSADTVLILPLQLVERA